MTVANMHDRLRWKAAHRKCSTERERWREREREKEKKRVCLRKEGDLMFHSPT